MLTTTADKKQDTKDILICVFKRAENTLDLEVGLFKRTTHITTRKYATYLEQTVNVYQAIDSDLIAIEEISSFGLKFLEHGDWVKINDKPCISTCKIIEYISFDVMRMNLFCEKKIPAYEIGKATDEEILNIYLHSFEYYKKKYNQNTK